MAKREVKLPMWLYLIVAEVIAGNATCNPVENDTRMIVPEGPVRQWVIYLLKRQGFDADGKPIGLPEVPEE